MELDRFRSNNNADAKERRSDDCNEDCIFRTSGKCTFETCLKEELPDIDVNNKTISCKCIICGNVITTAVWSIRNTDRICDQCIEDIREWKRKKGDILSHITHPL